jgi:hypothetical protein
MVIAGITNKIVERTKVPNENQVTKRVPFLFPIK